MTQSPLNQVVDANRAVPAFVLEEGNNGKKIEVKEDNSSKKVEPRYELIPTTSLKRMAEVYAREANENGDNEWKNGQKFSKLYADLFKHLMAWRNGEEDEDHMAEVARNAFAILHFEEVMPDLDDLEA